jgi:predicted small lipoprotein YifL
MVLAVTLAALAGLALSGCGRKGDPEIPGATPSRQATEAKPTTDSKPLVEDKPFVLDPLL